MAISLNNPTTLGFFYQTKYRIFLCLILLPFIISLPTWAQTQDIIVVPIKFDSLRVPYLELDVNDRVAMFMLDTGSKNGMHLTRQWMNYLTPNLNLLPDKQQSTDLTGVHIENDKFIIRQMTINGMQFEQISGVELQPWGLFTGEKAADQPDYWDGHGEMVVGLDLFANKQILINYTQQTLTIATPKIDLRPDASQWLALPWLMTDEGLTLQFKQSNAIPNLDYDHDNEHHYSLVLDSGASISMLSSQSTTTLSQLDCSEVGLDVDTGMLPCKVAFLQLLDEPQTSPLLVLVLDLDFGGFAQNGLIGYNFLQQHPVLIDFASQKIWISLATAQ